MLDRYFIAPIDLNRYLFYITNKYERNHRPNERRFTRNEVLQAMLSASDPYYVAKEEVAKAMDKLRGTSFSCNDFRKISWNLNGTDGAIVQTFFNSKQRWNPFIFLRLLLQKPPLFSFPFFRPPSRLEAATANRGHRAFSTLSAAARRDYRQFRKTCIKLMRTISNDVLFQTNIFFNGGKTIY